MPGRDESAWLARPGTNPDAQVCCFGADSQSESEASPAGTAATTGERLNDPRRPAGLNRRVGAVLPVPNQTGAGAV